MSRNLKALGLSLVAVVALSAMAASSAQAVSHHVTAGAEPAIITAHDETGEAKPVFKITAGNHKVECETVTYDGTLTKKTNTSITLTPTYPTGTAGECEVDGFVPASVHTNHCAYNLKNETDAGGHAKVELECSGTEENEITITYKLFGEPCVVHVPAQTPEQGVHYTQTVNPTTNKKDITAKVTAKGIEYTETRPVGGVFCPPTATKNDGTFEGAFTATAFEDNNGAGCAQATEGTSRTTPPSEATTTGCEGAAIDLELNEAAT